MKIKIRLCPKAAEARHHFKVRKNVFVLVQIFCAFPSPSFSAPAEQVPSQDDSVWRNAVKYKCNWLQAEGVCDEKNKFTD